MKIKTDGEIFLDYLQKHFEGNQRAFAEYAKKKTKGLGPQSISVLCRQTKFSKNDKEKLEKAGLPMDMFNSEIAEVEKIENEQTEITNVIIVPAVVAAGNGSLLFDDENFIREYIEHLGKQTHYRFLVSGDSMHPTIPNGSYIYTIPVLEVSKNNVYVFHMKNGELKIKRVKAITPKIIVLSSDNPDFPDVEIFLHDIHQIYWAKKSMIEL